MLGDKIRVSIKGYEEVLVDYNTSLKLLSEKYCTKEGSPVMLAVVNGRLKELSDLVIDQSEVEFLTLEHIDGFRVYQRSLCLLLIRAIYDVIGREIVEKVKIKHAIKRGYYCEINGPIQLTEDLLQEIENQMKKIVDQDEKIGKRTVSLDRALDFFEEAQMIDKLQLFKFRRISSVNLYKLGWLEDYVYGHMAYSTGCLKYFKLTLYAKGFILQMPMNQLPHDLPDFEEQNKLFNIFEESKEWSKILGVHTVGALNNTNAKGEIGNLIRVSEALHEKKIAKIADKIIENKEQKKIILIAGPSSSGKTTFAQRLSIQLSVNGLKPHAISIDDYFVNRELTPLDENGEYDFESIHAIDIEQFNKDLEALLRGETVEIPKFNFRTGKREYKGHFIQLNQEDILVIEGIHGLNELLTSSIGREQKYKIYISALTQLNVDDHNRIPTTDGRLLRRIVRDNQYRGMSAAKTIAMWPSVRRGEERNIFPFQEEADVMFNSAHLYELAVLKQFAEPLLFDITKEQPEYFEARRLIKFLDYFLGVSPEEIPRNSIIREFIGGSCFRK